MTWDPQQYGRFSGERARPFHDLLARVPVTRVRHAADLGCGTGALTGRVLERWPEADVIGIDSSEAMLLEAARALDRDGARPGGGPGRLRYELACIESWRSAAPLDLIVANASLHWVPDHAHLLPRLVSMLAPGGALAVQMPSNDDAPSFRALNDLMREPDWAARIDRSRVERPAVPPLEWSVRLLRRLGLEVDAWSTIYLHLLSGPRPVLEWMRGAALHPILSVLDRDDAGEFLGALNERLDMAYPEIDGVTIFPFRRIFYVAIKHRGRRAKEHTDGSRGR